MAQGPWLLRSTAVLLATFPFQPGPVRAGEPPGGWVAVGDRSFVSGDGERWVEAGTASANRPGPALSAVVYGLGSFLALSGGATPGQLLRSVDGRTWTPLGAGLPRVTTITFGGNRFFAAAPGRLLLSTDGNHFSEGAQLELPGQVTPRKAAYGSGEAGPRYVLLGETEGAPPQGRSYWRAASESGETWLSMTQSKEPLEDIAYGGGHFVVVGPGGLVESSQDGQIWHRHLTDTAADFSRVVWTGKRFIASAATGLWSSPDARTWTREAAGAPGIVAWADEELPLRIVLGWSGDLYLNRTGKDWVKAGLPGAPLLRAVARGQAGH